MKRAITVMLLFFSFNLYAQNLHLVKASFKGYNHGPKEITADSALAIVDVLLNSKDFRDSLKSLVFKNPDNNCGCNPNIKVVDGAINGSDAEQELFKILNPQIRLIYKKGYENGGLGVTPACTTRITSFVAAVRHNMSELPDASALAVNISHEYFHSLGYCHVYDSLDEPDRRLNGDSINWKYYKEDITYRIGWIAFDILYRWIKVEHRTYPYLHK